MQQDPAQDPDFQFVLKHLLDAYLPILEEELALAKVAGATGKGGLRQAPELRRRAGPGRPDLRHLLHRRRRNAAHPQGRSEVARAVRAMAMVHPAPPLLHDLRLAGLSRPAQFSGVRLLPLPLLALRASRAGACGEHPSHRRGTGGLPEPRPGAGRCIQALSDRSACFGGISPGICPTKCSRERSTV